MFKLLFISVLFCITVSLARRDPEEIIKDLDARLDAIDLLVEQNGTMDTSTFALSFADSKTVSGEGVCALEQSEDDKEYFSCEESESENIDISAADKVDEVPVQRGWLSGIKSYFGY